MRNIIILILILAALFRLYNIDYALPAIYEEATPMWQAWEMWDWGGEGFDFNPHFFNYPAFFFYIQFFAQAIYFGINFLMGRFETPHAMRLAFESDPTEIVLLARLLTVAFGLGAVWATYHLGKKSANHPVGLMAAGIMALAQIPIATSRTILVDVPLVFFGILALIEVAHPRLTLRQCVRTGLWIGLAASSKYTGALFAIPFASAHLLTHRGKHLSQLAIGLSVSAGVFLLTSPYCLLDFPAFWTDFSFERTHMATGHFGIDAARTEYIYAQDLWHSLGAGLIPAIPVGLWWILRHRKTHQQHTLPLLIFIIVYFGIISTWAMHAAHYLLPLFPPLAVIAAIGVHQIATHIHPSKWACGALAFLVLLPVGIQSARLLAASEHPDARTEAKRWIETHIPPGALIAVEFYTPDLKADTYHVARLPMNVLRPDVMAPFYDINWYADFDFIIISEGVAARYEAQPKKFAPQVAFYKTLKTRWQRTVSFAGAPYSGPGLHIYQHPDGRTSPPQPYATEQYETLTGVDARLAQGLLGQLARLFQKKGWFDKAIDVYSHILAITPDRADIQSELAMLLYQTGRFPEAEEMFTRALQGDLARPDYVRGMRFFMRSQPDSAAAAWERDRLTNKTDIALLANLGAVYFQKGDTVQAVHTWENGLQLNPTDPELINNLLYIYRAQQKTDRAVQMLQNALTIQPDNAELRAARDALLSQPNR